MRSPVGALIAAVTNRSPVPFAPTRFAQPFGIPLAGSSAPEQQMRAMGAVGTLFATVSALTDAVSQAEWRLYRKAASGDPADRVEVTRHLALDIWNRPNPHMTRQQFVEVFDQHLELVGESEWVVARDPRAPWPMELWPVRPDRMAPVPHPTEFLSGWVYQSPDGEQVPLKLDEVIQLRLPNPLDPYRGMGPVQSLLADLDATRYSAEWNRNFFVNSAEPGGIIEVPEALGDREFNQLRARWNEQHRGVANAHRVAILEHGKWVDRKFTQRDMQFAELRNVSRDVIREAFRVHKHILGSADDVNLANATAADLGFSRWLIRPRLERIKQALNARLLPMFGVTGEGVEFDYDDPTPADREADDRERESKAQAAEALVAAGYYPPEVLHAVGLPKIAFGQPDADPDRELLIDLVKGAPTLAPLLLPMLGYELPEPEPEPEPAPVPPALPAPPDDGPPPAARLRVRNAAEDDALEAVRTSFEGALARLLDAWAPVLEGQITALEDQIETALDGDDPDLSALSGLSVDTGQAETVLRDALAGMATTAADQMAGEASAQGVTVTPPTVDESVRAAAVPRVVDFGAELAGIALATVGLLASDLASSGGREALRLFTPGSSGRGVARRVGTFLRGLSDRFRRDQLGGAMHRAQNLGRLATLDAAPAATVYVATEVNDRNRCGPCAEIDGREFTDLGEVWAAYGAGPYRDCEGGIRCRGTVVARWNLEDT